MVDEFGPIGVEHLTNKRVDLHTIKDFVDELYMRRLARVLYVVLSLEDFRLVSYQAARHRPPSNRVSHLQQLYGMYISVDGHLPRGDVLLLYEDSDYK